MSHKAKAYILPFGQGLENVCTEETRTFINEHFDAVWNTSNQPYSHEQMAHILEDAEILLSSWGTPKLTPDLLQKASKLRYVGHAAGSVKGCLTKDIFAHDIKVFSGAPRLALSVGEYCLTVLLALLRRIPQCSSAVKQGAWWEIPERNQGHELTGNTIGIVSASSTARAFLQLLAPFKVKVLLYDPYLTEEHAQKLGVQLASIEDVMRCPIISIHAPSLPSTDNLIHKDLIQSISDGAILINSSRGSVLDEDALLKELQTGRFFAALDVFKKEPIIQDSPFTKLDNVLVTPHIAGHSVECFKALMLEIAQDIQRSSHNEPTRYEIYERMWEVLA
ncbi:hydroxyacid dehydrogenase [Paenibacillus qinlingensis]|uniref:Phosphoglycerate dehydrogenase-like enzyme n=1 Tax=Paenibacillus qinlingensis TaxID=1837343 RepID=A0ABU1NRF0_9BACL|nr:hydroxyacid dehydrogenase [Paenibacillus qinlingensis]MDR6550065.1 phosphoglycerate dehydrogenase-like enzyme [Paenibacillus qinlingensis]